MNNWQLDGALKADPIITYDPDKGYSILNFTLINSDRRKDWGDTRATWVSCVWKDPPLKAINSFKRGCQVYVRGEGFLAKRLRKMPGNEEWRTNTLGLEVAEGRVTAEEAHPANAQPGAG